MNARRIALVVLLACLWQLPDRAAAQQPSQASPPEPPIAMKGWRFERTPAFDLFTFYCEPPACAAAATFVYRISPPNTLTFDQYRGSAAPIAKQIEQAQPGTRVVLQGVDDLSRQVEDVAVRVFRMRLLVTASDGTEKHMQMGRVFGSRYSIGITSSSADQKVAEANFMQFAGPLWLVADDRLEALKKR
jgi:hypothetical protein